MDRDKYGFESRRMEKAALKSPQSKRWRASLASWNFAERLDCGAFTAAFEQPSNEVTKS
jgi:hypothetical protein